MPLVTVDRIQGLSGSVAIKRPVVCATTANILLEGLQTIDDVVLAAGDRVLVKDQTDPTENGVYEAGTSAWGRTLDFNKSNDAVRGTFVFAYRGSTNQGLWAQASPNPVIGADPITFSSVTLGGGGGDSLPALPDPSTDDGSGWVLSTDGVNYSWVQASTVVDSSTNTFATYQFVTVGGETTVSLPFAYTVGGRSLIVMVNGLVNYPSTHYTEDTPTTFTFLTALTAGLRVRVIANIVSSAFVPTDATLAALYALTPAANKFPYFTSGTEAALADVSAYVRSVMGAADASAFLTAIGAAAAASYSQLGVGQTWQDVAASRAVGTSYQNTTGKPIQVSILYASGGGSTAIEVSLNNTTWVTAASVSSGDDRGPLTAIVPNSHYYQLSGTGGSITHWAELR